MIRLNTHSADQTLELGRRLGQCLAPGMTVGLDGDLGAGKTWLAKGLVQGLGEFDPTAVKSPAFNLVHEYPVARQAAIQPVIHIDFYRLDTLSDTDFLLFSEYFERSEAIFVIEWANRFLSELVPAYLSVTLETSDDGASESRRIEITTVGSGYEDLIPELETRLASLESHAHPDS